MWKEEKKMSDNTDFNRVMQQALKTLSVNKNEDKVLYLDKVESIADCYGAPYYMCRFSDNTVLMIPKELLPMERIEKLYFSKKPDITTKEENLLILDKEENM